MFYHTATVKRYASTTAAGNETPTAWTTVTSSLACLAEGLPAWREATLFGDLAGAKFTFSWGTEALREDDRITLAHMPGRTFRLQLGTEDNGRPEGMTTIPSYKTGFLFEESVPRLA